MEVQMYVHLVYTLLSEKTGYESHWKGKNKVLLQFMLGDCSLTVHCLLSSRYRSQRKQPTIHDTTIGFPTKWCLRNDHRNSTVMMSHHPDLGGASDWFENLLHPIRSIIDIWVVTRHQYGIPVVVSQTSFHRETSGSIGKCGLFLRLYIHTHTEWINMNVSASQLV